MCSNEKINTLRRCRTVLFDCDGVLWSAGSLIRGARDLVTYLQDTDRQVFLLTNNSTHSLDQYHEICQTLGLPIKIDQIICSSNIAARYLSENNISGPVYVIGQVGLQLELDRFKISHTETVEPSDQKVVTPTCVLLGYDPNFDEVKLMNAVRCIEQGAAFFATADDDVIPTRCGNLPGTGPHIRAISTAADKEPFVFGKPHEAMFKMLEATHGVDADRTLMIGDNLYTDIKFGNRFHMHTICVLTGVTDRRDLLNLHDCESPWLIRPSMVFDSVQEILSELKQADSSN